MASAQALPSGWNSSDIGSPAVAGSATQSSGTYTVKGAGADTWGTSDQFRFAYTQLTGDGSIVARVQSVQQADAWSKGGVMIRETLTPGSKHVFMLASAAKGYSYQRRLSTGGSSVATSAGAGVAPVWVKLDRRGATFTASRSTDGSTWTVIGSDTINMTATVYAGLAVTSHNTAAAATVVFTNVTVQASAGSGLPSGWSAGDIGSPALKGSASFNGSAYTVVGGGADTWGTADQFQFVYRQVTGDIDVVARVASVTKAHDWSKAGVMVRETLTAGSKHGYMIVSAAKGLSFQRRTQTGGVTTATNLGTGAAPIFVKLQRRGSTLTALQSADGSAWSVVGTDIISMAATVYVGLAVTSHNVSATTTAAITHVSVTTPSVGTNQAPSVSLTSPASGATYNAPASIVVSASASDVDGTIARVDFYQGSTLIGSDTTAPYSVTWNNVGAGTYSLVATAHDNGGATATSSARTVTVNGASMPTKAVFVPSSNDSTAVTRYMFEVYTAGTNTTTATPLATQDIGKPPVVNGECTADVRTTISNLPSGNYVATVKAIGPGGSARSAPSATFAR